jgi:hypothetical protein
MSRHERETLFLRHNFTEAERLAMGADLAAAHNRKAAIDEEEAVVKSQFKERRASVEQSIGALSRNLANLFEMRNVPCRLEWDKPNPNEVSYIREDNGELVKSRPFEEHERQQELQLDASLYPDGEEQADDKPQPGDVVAADGPPDPPEEKPVSESAKVKKAKENLHKM